MSRKSNSYRIVATAPIEDVAIEILSKYAKFETAPDTSTDTLMSMLEGTIGIVVRGEGSAPAHVIHAAKELKVIGRPGVGYNNVDIKAAVGRKIPVVFTPGAGARTLAEGTMAMLLALAKRLPLWDQAVKQGQWNKRYEVKCYDLENATLGLVGIGRIGSVVAAMAQAFNMNIIAADPAITPQAAAQMGVKLVSLKELFQQSDYISIHAPLNDKTRGLINKELLAVLKPGAVLVNTSRGGLIQNLDILLEALNDGRLRAVGLDVFEPEPPDYSHPIFKHPGLLASPHAIGISYEGMNRICQIMAEEMAAIFEGRMPNKTNIVNPEVLTTV